MIRQQMEAQRASLAEKIETLEEKIVRTVEGAREAVAETVQTVKDSVQSSVDTVKDTVQSSVETVRETFDLPQQVRRHPWAMFGGSVAFGFAAGWLLNRATGTHNQGSAWGYAPASYTGGGRYSDAPPTSGSRFRDEMRPATSFTGAPSSGAGQSEARPAAAPPAGESWLDALSHTFAPEIQKVKGLAIGAAMGLVRDLVSQSVPDQLRPQLTELMNNVTSKMGGDPVRGELLDELLPRRHDGHTNGHARTPQEEFQG